VTFLAFAAFFSSVIYFLAAFLKANFDLSTAIFAAVAAFFFTALGEAKSFLVAFAFF